MGDLAQAADLTSHALATGESLHLPQILYPARHLRGTYLWSEGDLANALTEYRLAIEALDRLRGRLMVEHRAGFLVDKEEVYADAVRLCIQMDDPETGLEFVERAKSRALQDLLAYRVNLSLAPRRVEDAGPIDELHRLREKRDRTYRRWLAADQVKRARRRNAKQHGQKIGPTSRRLKRKLQVTGIRFSFEMPRTPARPRWNRPSGRRSTPWSRRVTPSSNILSPGTRSWSSSSGRMESLLSNCQPISTGSASCSSSFSLTCV